MGWCHAFGPQILEGCDHAMVAASDRCVCDDCGAVCHGLFPGCASVWAAGPRRVTISRPGREAGNLLPATTPVVPAERPGAPANDPAAVTAAADQSELRALRVDMQVLMWKFEQLQQATPAGEQIVAAANQLRSATDALPRQLQEAVAAALDTQRHTTRTMLIEISQKIFADVGQLQGWLRNELRAAAPTTPTAPTAATVGDLDARFQWLVDAISARFVTLGNELAQIERLLGADEGSVATDRSHNGSNGNATTTELSGGALNGGGRHSRPHATEAGRTRPVAVSADDARP